MKYTFKRIWVENTRVTERRMRSWETEATKSFLVVPEMT